MGKVEFRLLSPVSQVVKTFVVEIETRLMKRDSGVQGMPSLTVS